MSQNLEKLFALEGGAKRRVAKKGSKKASKGKKAQRGGGQCEDYYNSIASTLPAGTDVQTMISLCNGALTAAGTGADKEAKRKKISEMCVGLTPKVMTSCMNTREALAKTINGGGKRRGSKKASKGKKAQRGGGQCEDFYGADATKVARCNAIMNFDASKQKKEDLRQPCSAEGLKQAEINACMRKALSGGKRGSKKASKGSRKH